MDKKEGQKTNSELIKGIWKLVAPYKSSVRKASFWIILNQLASLVEPAIMMVLLDHLVEQKTSGKADRSAFLMMCAGALAAYAILGLGNTLKSTAVYRITSQIEFDLKVDSLGKALRLPIFYYQSNNSGQFMGSISRGVGQSINVMWTLAFEILPVLATSVIAFTALCIIKPLAVLAMSPFLALFFLLTSIYRRRTAAARKENEDIHEKADSQMSEVMENIHTVQAYGQEEREHNKLTDLWASELELDLKLESKMRNWSYLSEIILTGGRISIIALCGLAVFDGSMTVGQLFFVLQLAGQTFWAARSLNRFQRTLMRAEEPILRTLNMLQSKQTDESLNRRRSRNEPKLKGKIEFHQVCYSYPKLDPTQDDKADATVLRDISFKVKHGSLVGIVGASGGGKTTLLNLLMGFDKPNEKGYVAIDDRELDESLKHDLRRSSSLVASRVELQSATVFENIAYGLPEATDDDVREAAELANAHDFIMEMPKGYNEKIGNHGARLSAGQQQRICLARALVRKPSILVLDEATMHLDAENAVDFKRTVDGLRGKCTVVHATHNIWEIADAELILVINKGVLEAKGTHSELLANCPLYRRMHDKQSTMLISMARSISKLELN